MSRSVHDIADKLQLRQADNKSGVLSGRRGFKAMEIAQTLQTTLDIEHVVRLFGSELKALVPHSGLHYINADQRLDIKIGHQARHSCTYTLPLGDEPLGKLTLLRGTKFAEAELEKIEQLLCALLYPLRNALLYHDAIQMAQKDPLTGIYNRAALDEMLRRELSHAARHQSSCSIIMIDIDRFKKINDHYGHIIGDCALKVVANTANQCIRDGDQLFRYGGEEFVVLMRETSLKGARLLAERIRKNIEQTPCHCSGTDIKMTISAGISTFVTGDTPLTLFGRADEAMYKAKQNGRNQTCVITPATH